MARALIKGFGLLAVLLFLARLGWMLWMCQTQQRRSAEQLLETQASLAKHQETLKLLEEERTKLAGAYDTLKARWATDEDTLKRYVQTSEQMTIDLKQLASERAALQHQLEEAHTRSTQLRNQLGTLQQALAAEGAARGRLEAQLTDEKTRALTSTEAEQLAAALASQRAEAQRLQDHFAELSRLYEQTLSMRKATTSSDLTAQADVADEESSVTAMAPLAMKMERQQRASLYRDLGAMYESASQYVKAAEAFEESLTFEELPAVHAKLAWLYSRFLHDPSRAALHANRLPPGYPAERELGTSAQIYGLPRKSWQLFWQWLMQG